MSVPDVKVEVAFTSGYATPIASMVWTDVSEYVEGQEAVTITRGRDDEQSQVNPSQLTLTFDNRDARFTPGNTAGAYYPNVKIGRPIRVTVTPSGGVASVRFFGYVTEWPVVWPEATDTSCQVTVTASSRMARLAAGAELRSIVEEEYLRDVSPVAYYPLGEGEGATSAASVVGGAPDLVVTQKPGTTGGTVEFGAGTGPGTDGLSAPVLTPTDSTGLSGKYLHAEFSRVDAPVTVLECFFNSTRVRFQPLIAVERRGSTGSASRYMRLVTDSSGNLYCELFNFNLSASLFTTGKNYLDGATHHALAQVSSNGVFELYVDGVLKSSMAMPEMLLSTSTLRVGGYNDGGSVFEGTLAHAAVGDTILTAAQIAARADAGLTGFAGETAPARLRRLGAYSGVADVEIVTAASGVGVAHSDTTGRTALDVMQEVAETESGLLFDGRDGSLVLHPRDHRYNAAPVFTVDASAQEVESDLAMVLDDRFLVNDVTASDGTNSARATDAASVAEYGPRRQDVAVVPASVDDLAGVAEWRLRRFHEPKVTLGQITVDVLHVAPTLAADVLSADLGDRFTVEGLPSQAPQLSLSMFIEGTTETVSASAHTVSLNVSSADLFDVWELDSTSYSQLDSTTLLAL